jgi:hypothetical protein
MTASQSTGIHPQHLTALASMSDRATIAEQSVLWQILLPLELSHLPGDASCASTIRELCLVLGSYETSLALQMLISQLHRSCPGVSELQILPLRGVRCSGKSCTVPDTISADFTKAAMAPILLKPNLSASRMRSVS